MKVSQECYQPMLIILLLIMMIGAALVHLFRKYILQIKEPTVEELWAQLESQSWFQDLLRDPAASSYIYHAREQGFLNDAHYVHKLLFHDGTRKGFLQYVKARTKEAHPRD